jgi:sugar phosphate isomerase/epimerase
MLGQTKQRPELINYYRGHAEICRKSALVKTLRRLCDDEGLEITSIIPSSFIIRPNETNDEV